VSDDKTKREPTGNGFPLHGRRRVLIIAVIVVASALVAIGAVIAVVNDLSQRDEDDSSEVGASATDAATPPPAGESTPSPDQGATAAPETDPAAPPADAGAVPPVETPVEIDAPATFDASVTAEVTQVESVQGEAQGPGEIGGPALRVSISLANGTGRDVDLDTSVVALFYGADDIPAAELSGPGAERFQGTLKAGATASGVYVFRVPADERDIRITVSYSPTDTTVAFEGSVR
jgi:hypothetical protein